MSSFFFSFGICQKTCCKRCICESSQWFTVSLKIKVVQIFHFQRLKKCRLLSKGGIFLNLLFNILQCKSHCVSNMDVDKNKNASFFFPAGEVYQNQLRCRRIHRWGQYRNLYPHFQDRQKKNPLWLHDSKKTFKQSLSIYYTLFSKEKTFLNGVLHFSF